MQSCWLERLMGVARSVVRKRLVADVVDQLDSSSVTVEVAVVVYLDMSCVDCCDCDCLVVPVVVGVGMLIDL